MYRKNESVTTAVATLAAILTCGLFADRAVALEPSAAEAPAAAVVAATADSIDVALKPDVPEGYPDRVGKFVKPLRQDLKVMRLIPSATGAGKFDLCFPDDAAIPVLKDVDLRHFMARVPPLAVGDATLTRVALIQRELGRNQVKFDLPSYGSLWLANNCLKVGLWEVGIDRPDGAGNTPTVFHAWFDFPQAQYETLFAMVHPGSTPPAVSEFSGYPILTGFSVPLDALRTVSSETPVEVTTYGQEPVMALSEQARKAKLLVTQGIKTNSDFAAPANQPITVAKFSEPGFYTNADPMKFDLTWLGKTEGAYWREASRPGVEAKFVELELRFANGNRILIADSAIPTLPARSEPPKNEPDVLKLTFGIGTPDIYASAKERADEFEKNRPNYLLLLDASGNHMDNHTTGIDRAYLWREAGEPGRLHVHLVGYERIALVAHYSVPFQAR